MERLLKGSDSVGRSGLDRRIVSDFERLMDDDMNTPAALGMLGKLLVDGKGSDTVRYLLRVLGF